MNQYERTLRTQARKQEKAACRARARGFNYLASQHEDLARRFQEDAEREAGDLVGGAPRMREAKAERERWHGTHGGYTNHGCRCEDCTRANTEAHLDYMQRHPEQRQKLRDYMWRSYVPAYARKRGS